METPSFDFSNKIVFIYKVKGNVDSTLQNPHFEVHNERLFLVGKIPEGGSANDWLAGLTAYIAWDEIGEIVIFDSLEEFHSRLSRTWNDTVIQ